MNQQTSSGSACNRALHARIRRKLSSSWGRKDSPAATRSSQISLPPLSSCVSSFPSKKKVTDSSRSDDLKVERKKLFPKRLVPTGGNYEFCSSLSKNENLEDEEESSPSSSFSSSSRYPFIGTTNSLPCYLSNENVDWNLVEERIRSHPSEVAMLDNRGQTCLSRACSIHPSPPVHIIQIMLEECRFGSEVLRDKNGQTALLIALQQQVPLDILETLARFQRRSFLIADSMLLTSNHQGELPLHIACSQKTYRDSFQLVEEVVRLFLEIAPEAASVETNTGKTSLHIALEKKAPERVISMLLKACPGAASADACGYTPLVAAIRRKAPSNICNLLVCADPNVTSQRDDTGQYPLSRALERGCNDPQIIRLLCTSFEVVLGRGGKEHEQKTAQKQNHHRRPQHHLLQQQQQQQYSPLVIARKPPLRSPKQSRLPFRPRDQSLTRKSPGSPNADWAGDRVPYFSNNALRLSLSQVSVNPDLVQILLEKIPPEACHFLSEHGSEKHSTCSSPPTPLEMVYHRYTNAVQLLNHLKQRQQQGRGLGGWLGGRGLDTQDAPLSSTAHSGLSIIHASQEAENWWKVVVIMLDFLAHKKTTATPELSCTLHTALVTAAPPQVIRTILNHHPEQVYRKDDNGRYPLHLACTPLRADIPAAAHGHRQIQARAEEIITSLLNAEVIAASRELQGDMATISPAANRDNYGRYALNLWTEFLGVTGNVCSGEVMQQLICAYPGALGVLDSKFNLFPFLVVAAGQSLVQPTRAEQRHAGEISDAGRVSAIYTILREQPNLIKGAGGQGRTSIAGD